MNIEMIWIVFFCVCVASFIRSIMSWKHKNTFLMVLLTLIRHFAISIVSIKRTFAEFLCSRLKLNAFIEKNCYYKL